RGSLNVSTDSSLLQLRQQTLSAFKPFLESGGLIDKKPFLLRKHEPVASRPGPGNQRERWAVVLIAIALLIASPLAISRLMPKRRGSVSAKPASRPWSLLLIGALLVVAAMVAVRPSVFLVAHGFLESWAPVDADQVGAVVGGMAWGWLTLLVSRLALPKIPGMRGIRHDNVGPLLKTWCYVSFLRLFSISLFCLPFVLAVWQGSELLQLSPQLAVGVIAPVSGLLVYFWLVSLVDHLSHHLDQRLVEGEASTRNPWHPAVRKYFRGYVRRLGLDIDRSLLDRVLFLPGRVDGVVAYGGFSRPRIVIDLATLELALGPVQQEDVESQAPPIAPGAWPLGLVVPEESTDAASQGDEPLQGDEPPRRRGWARRAKRLRAARQRHSRAAPRWRTWARPPLIGENATVLGYLKPLAVDEAVPLIANDQEDFGVVRQLLTEHYGGFEKGWFDDEYDDTDPTQKDFLFGAVLHQLGSLQRGDTLAATLALTSREYLAGVSGVTRAIARFPGSLIQRFFSRHPAILADAYAVLNQGRNHLIQYLHYSRTKSQDLLTTRAATPRLFRVSQQILEKTAGEEVTGEDRQLLRASLRNRLVWISRHFYLPIPETRKSRVGVVITVGMLFAAATVLAVSINESIEYHSDYLERMRQQQVGQTEPTAKGRSGDVE
ncbi:hypothetical protein ACFL6C_12785, partial [Myxococcota bacterium]